ncbi:MAG: mitomycin antibiotic biosynthesis protein, partial [Pseudomonadota bacterium]|nr:mitomycin antibiotic biosynthesis protein [Pseudomonadota bacterium]
MATIEHLSADATTDAIVEVLERDGAVIIDGLMASDEVAHLNEDLAPFLSKEVYGRDEFTGYKTQRIGALVARSQACQQGAVNPLMLASARQYLAQFCDDIQLHFTSAVAIAPGE